LSNFWDCHIEYTLFFRRSALDGFRFREDIGVGAGTLWGSGEATEMLARLLRSGVRCYYRHDLSVIHPATINLLSKKDVNPAIAYKYVQYALGWGYTLGVSNPPTRVWGRHLLAPLIKGSLALVKLQPNYVRMHFATALARGVGFLVGKIV
jgi:hypothetical protein